MSSGGDELTKKKSEYQIYRELKWQEKINPKNKWDNRLNFSLRYKHFSYVDEKIDEIFKKRKNHESFYIMLYQRNAYWVKRAMMLYENMIWGTNKYGQKKLYKLDRFSQPKRLMIFIGMFLFSFNLVYLGFAYYYKKLEHDIWMNSYGDYFPKYEKAGVFTVRSIFRKIPYYMHSWKLVSIYHFRKYDVMTVQFPTGYGYSWINAYIARENEYKSKRDNTFDFMQIGENDFDEYSDKLA